MRTSSCTLRHQMKADMMYALMHRQDAEQRVCTRQVVVDSRQQRLQDLTEPYTILVIGWTLYTD